MSRKADAYRNMRVELLQLMETAESVVYTRFTLWYNNLIRGRKKRPADAEGRNLRKGAAWRINTVVKWLPRLS